MARILRPKSTEDAVFRERGNDLAITNFEKRNLQNSSLVHLLTGCVMFFMPEPIFVRYFSYASTEVAQILALAALVLKVLGLGATGISLADLAESKGHSRWWGLLFLLPVLGWIVVVALSDRNQPWSGTIYVRRYRFH